MRIAAIDIGTNSVHMIVVRIRPDLSFEVVDREKDMIRLGTGGLDGRRLPDTTVATALMTLAKFKRLAESHGVDETIATATSAVREAENGGDFIAEVRRGLGIRVRVISGTEEARLIHLAAAYAAGVGPRPSVVIDIGGGSVEITLGTAARMQLGRSFKLGVIRLTERYVTTDPLSDRDERRLVKHIRRETHAHLKQIAARGYTRVIGTSGTILALGAIADGPARGADIRNRRVTVKSLRRLRRRLTSATLEERLAIPGLDAQRADLSVAGSVLLDTLVAGLDADEITLCDFALREGLVLDYIKKNGAHIRTVERYPDVRRRSVVELAERCNYLAPHAAQVARLATLLFEATRDRHGLGDRERQWLEYAALLHDIGVHISYESHHKHSYYLVKHGDLRGFDPGEIEIIALVARYHRQATPRRSHEGFAGLSRESRRTVRLLGAMLRLAEGLDRSHAQVVTGVEVRRDEPGLVMALSASGDAELELWAAARHAAPLAQLLDCDIRFDAAAAAAAVKDDTPHDEHAQHPAHVPRPPVRRRGHRRVGQDHATRPAGEVARRVRSAGVRH